MKQDNKPKSAGRDKEKEQNRITGNSNLMYRDASSFILYEMTELPY